MIASGCTDGEDRSSTDPTPAVTVDEAVTDEASTSTSSTANLDETDDAGPTGGFVPRPLDWSDCDGFECATLEVPLDYGQPDGERIEIAVIRSATSSSDRIGSVVLNPGGPGGSGIDYLPIGVVTLPPEVQSRFDLVSFDPRGVGASTSIDCDLDFDDNITLIEPGDDPAWEALVALEEADLTDCDGGAIAPYVGTNNAARDLDVLRAALGDEQLTYIGYSYGTRLGAVYAELFPENVRALVLDAAVLPDSDLNALERAQAAGFDLAFQNFASACDGDPDCLLADIGPTIEVIETLEAELSEVESFPVDGGRKLTAAEFKLAIVAALYSVESWPILVEGLFVADTLGDGTILQFLADSFLDRQPDGSYSNQSEANRFINCADDPSRATLDETRAAVTESGRQSEYFGEVFWSSVGCFFTPDPIDPLRIGPAEGAPPILVIGNTGDPATPYEWSVELADTLESGVLYTVEAEGHTAYGTFDCLEDDVNAYLVDLTIPETRECSANADTDFFPPSGESQIDLIIGFFDCLIDEGLDIAPVTTADILADPTGESLFADVDTNDPATAGAILACQSFLTELL